MSLRDAFVLGFVCGEIFFALSLVVYAAWKSRGRVR